MAMSYRTFCDDAVLWRRPAILFTWPDLAGLEARAERLLLADCYRRAMTRAVTSGCKKHCVSTYFSGEYHIPREEAIYIAGQAITDFIRRSPALDVVLVLYKPGNLSDGQTDFGMGRYTQL